MQEIGCAGIEINVSSPSLLAALHPSRSRSTACDHAGLAFHAITRASSNHCGAPGGERRRASFPPCPPVRQSLIVASHSLIFLILPSRSLGGIYIWEYYIKLSQRNQPDLGHLFRRPQRNGVSQHPYPRRTMHGVDFDQLHQRYRPEDVLALRLT